MEYEEEKTAVSVSHCKVKRSRRGDELEILLTKRTDFAKSDKSFDVGSSCSGNEKTDRAEGTAKSEVFQAI